jgi:iron complex transport system substrate-binding protein
MKAVKSAVVILIIIFSIVGCKAGKEKTVTSGGAISRVISTAPSNTEIIVDLGMAHKLVAVDVHSANVTGIPEGLVLLNFFYPDAEVIINLKPDLIIASSHNPTGTGEDPFRLMREMGIPVVYISMSQTVEDIYKDIAKIAELLHAGRGGEILINSMKAQIEEITNFIRLTPQTQKTVYFEISIAPDMVTFGKGSFINDMITVIGARNIFEDDGWLVRPGAEAIIERNPDVILTNVNYIEDPINEIKERPGFEHINAVIKDRIYQIDNDSSSRPSSRIILALRQMSQAVYPEFFKQ